MTRAAAAITGMIDTHSHLLPGVDDGCKSVEESVVCGRQLAAAGYSHVFCTPHIWANLAGNHVGSVPDMVARLQREYDRADVPITLLPGGEMNLRKDLTEVLPTYVVTYGMRGNYALIDLWADRLPPHFEPGVRWLQGLGMKVILAHPERMRAVQDDPGLANYFAELGLFLQGNLQCFNDRPTAPTRRVADRFLAERRYWMLGSDTHGVVGLGERLAGLARVRASVDSATFDRLTRQNPSRLLE